MSVSFENWIQTVFDHAPHGPEWFWDPEFASLWDSLGLSDALTVNYLTRLFLNPEPLNAYSLEQVAQGIWFLIGESSPAQPSYTLLRPEVDLNDRTTCIHSMSQFFRSFVAPAAPGTAEIDADPFHVACYMWWDIFPSWGGEKSGEPAIHQACLEVMTEVLLLPAELCHISALHGLNHWHLHHAAETERIIDNFLARSSTITSRVREYAMHARKGICQ